MTAAIAFWTAFAVLAYTYLAYPLLIGALAALRRRPQRRLAIEPTVSVLLIVRNEALRIRERLDNLLTLDYPGQRLEIVVVSDGSSDDSVAQAQRYGDRGVKVIEYSQARGREAILNQLVPRLWGEVIMLADIRQRVEVGTLRELVANFADPRVGMVCAETLLDNGQPRAGRYERFVRRCEVRHDSCLLAAGALYALRRRLFQVVPESSLSDGVLIPVQMLRQGYRVLFDGRARVWEQVQPRAGEENFNHKVRAVTGLCHLLFREPWLLNPRANRLWFQVISHRVCRLLGPLCLLVLFAANLVLADQFGYRLFLTLQILFYSAAIAGFLLRKPLPPRSLLDVPYAFCAANLATVLGFARFLLQRDALRLQKVKG